MTLENDIKHFILNNLSIRADLKGVEQRLDENVLVKRSDSSQEKYYPQFSDKLRHEAQEMADHYRIFYCLENFLRNLITAKLEDEHGEKWWDTAVPEAVRNNATASRKKEISSGVTPRSDLLIDYTNFGELNEIVQANWTNFGDVFRDQGALRGVLSRLNTLRNPIAHCKPLAEDEVVRLHLSLRDFFRQMGS